jgi:hypothetical protein
VRLPARNASIQTRSTGDTLPKLKSGLVHVLGEAVTRITQDKVDGDIVDCGTGETEHLYASAKLLKEIGDTRRKLILFDTSMDPAHRALKTMPLWGPCNEAPFRDAHHKIKHGGEKDKLPGELIATRYPANNIVIETHVTDRAIQSSLPQQIALLILSCDSHRANAIVLQKVLPQLAKGAAIIVRGYSPEIAGENIAIQLLRKYVPKVDLVQAWDTYWISKT